MARNINPDQLSTINPREFYPDGNLEGYVNPIPLTTYRGLGSWIPGSSNQSLTIIGDPNSYAVPDPGSRRDANMSRLATHDAHPVGTAEPRTQEGVLGKAQLDATTPPPPQGVYLYLQKAKDLFQSSPVAAVFLGLGGLLVFNHFALKNAGVGRGGARVGRSVASVGQSAGSGAASTSKSGIDAVNDAIGGAVEAVEGIAK